MHACICKKKIKKMFAYSKVSLKQLDRSYVGVSVVSLDKSLEVNHISARVGDNVEIKCDVTGTPPPPLMWRRNGADLETLNEPEVQRSDFLRKIVSFSFLRLYNK